MGLNPFRESKTGSTDRLREVGELGSLAAAAEKEICFSGSFSLPSSPSLHYNLLSLAPLLLCHLLRQFYCFSSLQSTAPVPLYRRRRDAPAPLEIRGGRSSFANIQTLNSSNLQIFGRLVFYSLLADNPTLVSWTFHLLRPGPLHRQGESQLPAPLPPPSHCP